jgi:hypothetical protein
MSICNQSLGVRASRVRPREKIMFTKSLSIGLLGICPLSSCARFPPSRPTIRVTRTSRACLPWMRVATAAVAKTMGAHQLQSKGVHTGGFHLPPTTMEAISKGDLDFTIDQQPYLQGFYTVMVLFIYKISGEFDRTVRHQHRPQFPGKDPFLHTQSRYEGNSSEEKVLTRSGAI